MFHLHLTEDGEYIVSWNTVTINEIIDIQGNLKLLSPPSGGAYGLMNINNYLMKLIEETFTKKKMNDLRKNRYDLWKITLDSIEKKKKELRDNEFDAPNYIMNIVKLFIFQT